jgi:glycosyltransferase involved in cell wall biosynthesis
LELACNVRRIRIAMPPALTAFIPLKHYEEAYLRQAIDSVFQQTEPAWELLIVVDPGDEEHFRRVLAAPLADARVRCVINSGRLLAGAYNSAMAAARTEFIAPLLGDDLWATNAVEVLASAIRDHPEVDFFHCGRYFVDDDGRRVSSDYLPGRPVTAEAFATVSPVHHLFCWRVRTGLACGGVDESLNNHGSDDYDFPWTMLEHGAVFHAIPRALYVVRDHRRGYRLTTHVPRSVQLRELRRILEKHGVAPEAVRRKLRAARRSYLRQSLFHNGLHRWLLERIGFDAGRGARQRYR